MTYRVCDDELLIRELGEAVELARTADGLKVGEVLDRVTVTNIVLAIVEGSEAIDRAIERSKK